VKLATLIAPEELATILGAADLLVVDCRFDLTDPARAARDYSQAHIPGAVYAHLDDDLSDLTKTGCGRHPLPDAAAFSAVLRRWGWTPQTRVVAYDAASGALAAARLWWMLRLVGANEAAVLDGGLGAWTAAALPLDAHEVARTPSSIEVDFDRSKIVYNEQLYALREDPAVLILDARAVPRFRGEVEPIDKVAGHIPGARNRPFSDNLEGAGRFKSEAALREELQNLLAGHAAQDVIHSCGSGVTACHNLLAFEHAGLTGSRVYAPSWSGWIADPNNPVELG
jgi:thiosulfate/3-mercaptopyruvate sulfurtransferase